MKIEHVLFSSNTKKMSETCQKLAFTHPIVVLKSGLKNNWMKKLDRVNRPLKVTKQRPMNNEYVNSWISQLSPMTLAGIFKPYSKFYQRYRQETTRPTVKYFIMPAFPWVAKAITWLKSSLLNASVLLSRGRGTIMSSPKVRRVVGIPCQFLIERTHTSFRNSVISLSNKMRKLIIF